MCCTCISNPLINSVCSTNPVYSDPNYREFIKNLRISNVESEILLEIQWLTDNATILSIKIEPKIDRESFSLITFCVWQVSHAPTYQI